MRQFQQIVYYDCRASQGNNGTLVCKLNADNRSYKINNYLTFHSWTRFVVKMDAEIVRIEKLQDAAQFASWKFQVRVTLNANEIFGVVSGLELKPQPAATTATAAEKTEAIKNIADWNKKDARAQKVIATAVSQKLIIHIMNCESAKEMWDKLHAVFERNNDMSKQHLQEKFFNFQKDESDDMATHFSKIEALVQQMKSLSVQIDDSMVMTKIITTLPQEYRHFASAWESTAENLRTIANLNNRLMIEESRLNTSGVFGGGEAFLTRSNNKNSKQVPNKRKGKCFKCGSSTHWKRDCRVSKSSNECKPTKEDIEKGKGKVFFGEMTSSSNKHTMWLFDSGATHHMSKQRDWFRDYIDFATPKSITLGNGDAMYAVGQGNIHVLAYNGTKWDEKTLTNVLLVPELYTNLFSQTKVLDNGHTLRSNKNEVKIYDGEIVVAVGARRGDLFQMFFQTIKPSEMTANVTIKKDTLRKWHARLGHQNVAHVRSFLRINGIDFIDEEFDCDGCAFGKMHRLSFGEREEKAKKCGEIIHADVCGPANVTSLGGARYFLLLKDDYSHLRTVYFLKQKSEVITNLKKFIKWSEKQSGHPIKILRSDNGTEFINTEVMEFLNKNGIEHQRTVPYTPEQNGCAEREIRTTVEAARAMIYAKDLNVNLWAEAINSAVYILNRTSTSTVKNKTPWELWYGKQVTFNHLHVFGSEVYVHIPKEKRRKLDAKAKKCLFVGYDNYVKGFRVFDTKTNTIEIARDVKFLLNEFSTSSDENSKGEEGQHDDEDKFATIISTNNQETNHEILQQKQNDDNQGASTQQVRSTQIVQQRQKNFADIDEDNILDTRMRPRVSMSMMACMAAFDIDNEPKNFDEAVKSQSKVEWQRAMEDEFDSLIKNKTWILVDKPEKQKVIDNKWVFKIKRNPNGSVVRYKARLVARGFNQQHGIDYEETFSPVVRFTSIRTMLSIAAKNRYTVKQFDVTTAFLYGDLEEEVYMKQPIGFSDNSDRVCKLQKSLYGLKQSSRCWNIKFKTFIEEFGFVATESDPCVFISSKSDDIVILAIYVDDGLIMGNNERDIDAVIEHLQKKFEVKTMELGCFLGIEIKQMNNGSIFIHQAAYAHKVLSKFEMNECKPVTVPADPNQVLHNFNDSEQASYPYRQLVGSLLYLAMATRPDIAFAISNVSRYLERPTTVHITAAKRILKYIKGTIDHGILYKNECDNKIIGYSDADYAGCLETRRSTTGFAFLIAGGVVSWCSKRQNSVSMSTTESEYVAASEAVMELTWLQRLVNELCYGQFRTAHFFMDNQSAEKLVKNPVFHKRTKHIDTRYHFIREKYKGGLFKLDYVGTEEQMADLFTKALPRKRFVFFRVKLGIVKIGEI